MIGNRDQNLMLNEDILQRINSSVKQSKPLSWSPLGRERKISLNYSLDGLARARFRAIQKSCEGLAASKRVWLVDEWEKPDWKINAGTLRVTSRCRIRAGRMEAPELRTNVEVWGLDTGDLKLFLFPDRVLIHENSRYRAVEYSVLEVDFSTDRFVEERVPKDAEVVGHTWRRVNADGSPEERRGRNPRIPIALYGHLRVSVANGPTIRLQISDTAAGLRFARALGFEQGEEPRNDRRERRGAFVRASREITVEGARRILGVSADASTRETVTAYRRMARRFHPDKVATLTAEARESAERRMKEINAAYEMLKRQPT